MRTAADTDRGPVVRTRSARPDDRLVASLMFGVAGLFFFNLVFGPFAIVLGIVAARRQQRGRLPYFAALAGIVLGVADLVVLAVVTVHAMSGPGFGWSA